MQSTSEVLPVANQNIQNEGNWHSTEQNIQVQGFGDEFSQMMKFPSQHLDNTLLGQQRPYMTGGEQWQEYQQQQQQQQFFLSNQIHQLNPILLQQMEMDVPTQHQQLQKQQQTQQQQQQQQKYLQPGFLNEMQQNSPMQQQQQQPHVHPVNWHELIQGQQGGPLSGFK